ncbi:MAG: ATP-binding protein [Streptosporangiaceae bacterium]
MDAQPLGLIGRTGDDGGLVAAWEFAPDLRSPGRARAAARSTLERWRVQDPADIDDVVLMVDELVANAVVHGSGPVRVRLSVRGLMLRAEITDGSPDRPPEPPREGRPLDAEGGRGLFLVAILSSQTGTEPCGAGKSVWFTRLLTGSAP